MTTFESLENLEPWINMESDCFVPISTQRKLFTLINEHPDGLPLTNLDKAFTNKFGHNIDVLQCSVLNVTQLIASLPKIFRYVSVNKKDIILFCAQAPIRDTERILKIQKIDFTPGHVKQKIRSLLREADEMNPNIGGLFQDDLPKLFKKKYSMILDPLNYQHEDLESFIKFHEGTLFKRTVCDGKTLLVDIPSNEPEYESNKQYDLFLLQKMNRSSFPENVLSPHEQIPPLDFDVDLPIGAIVPAITRYAKDKSCYISLKKYGSAIETLLMDMEEYYEEHGDELKMPEWAVVNGVYCAAYYNDKKWYRVQVMEPISTKVVMCYYSDYGHTWCLKKESLRYLHKRFATLPRQAILATMANDDGLEWNKTTITYFETVLRTEDLHIVIVESDPTAYMVKVHFYGDQIDFKQLLISQVLSNALDKATLTKGDKSGGTEEKKDSDSLDGVFPEEDLTPFEPSSVAPNDYVTKWMSENSASSASPLFNPFPLSTLSPEVPPKRTANVFAVSHSERLEKPTSEYFVSGSSPDRCLERQLSAASPRTSVGSKWPENYHRPSNVASSPLEMRSERPQMAFSSDLCTPPITPSLQRSEERKSPFRSSGSPPNIYQRSFCNYHVPSYPQNSKHEFSAPFLPYSYPHMLPMHLKNTPMYEPSFNHSAMQSHPGYSHPVPLAIPAAINYPPQPYYFFPLPPVTVNTCTPPSEPFINTFPTLGYPAKMNYFHGPCPTLKTPETPPPGFYEYQKTKLPAIEQENAMRSWMIPNCALKPTGATTVSAGWAPNDVTNQLVYKDNPGDLSYQYLRDMRSFESSFYDGCQTFKASVSTSEMQALIDSKANEDGETGIINEPYDGEIPPPLLSPTSSPEGLGEPFSGEIPPPLESPKKSREIANGGTSKLLRRPAQRSLHFPEKTEDLHPDISLLCDKKSKTCGEQKIASKIVAIKLHRYSLLKVMLDDRPHLIVQDIALKFCESDRNQPIWLEEIRESPRFRFFRPPYSSFAVLYEQLAMMDFKLTEGKEVDLIPLELLPQFLFVEKLASMTAIRTLLKGLMMHCRATDLDWKDESDRCMPEMLL